MSGSRHKPGSQISADNYQDFGAYRRLDVLRGRGLDEFFYSLSDPDHAREYGDIVAELRFYQFPYEVIELPGGVVFLFLKPEVAAEIGISRRRHLLNETLKREPENN